MNSGSRVKIKENRNEQGGTNIFPVNSLNIQNQAETGRGLSLNFVAN